MIVGWGLVRGRFTDPASASSTKLIVDLPAVVGIGVLALLIFRSFGELYRELRARNSELLALNEAALDISGELDIDTVLQKVVDRAARLLDARYGALAVYEENGTIARFLTCGMSYHERQRLGAPPQGRGLLGEVLNHGETLRVAEIGEHPRSAGFPANHPPMRALLAVPIPSRAPWKGNLYLADRAGGSEFDADDERTLQRFAAQAALAINAAHTHGQLRGSAVAEERKRIAHELHDGLAQVLASVITSTQAIREYVRSGRLEEATTLLEQLRVAADSTYKETREGILALRAAASGAELSLSRILREYLAEWQERTGISVDARIDEEVDLPKNIELQLVRIAQESLANVRKHSNAARVEFVLEQRSEELRLLVRDDGIGIGTPPPGGAGSPRFGLATMRERAQAIGARLEIAAESPHGTRVQLSMPAQPSVLSEQRS